MSRQEGIEGPRAMTGSDDLRPPDSTAVDRAVLEAIAKGRPLRDVLDVIARGLESLMPGWLVSILLVASDGETLHHGAAPSLPESYVRLIDGRTAGPIAGSCGTAVYRRATVIVEDIAVDPLWQEYRPLAERHGLRACWSVPVWDGRGPVLATFAVYLRSPAAPEPRHLRMMERYVHLTLIAIQHDRAQRELVASEERFRTLFRDAAFGLAVADLSGRFVQANVAYQQMLGYDESELRALRFVDVTLPDDWPANAVLVDDLLAGRRDAFVLEKRYVARDGRVFPARVTVSARRDADGQIAETIAIAEDISQQRAAEADRARQQRLLEMASEVGHLGAWSLEVPSYVMHLSEEALAIRGFPPDAAPTPTDLAAQFDPEHLPQLLAASRACIRDGTPFDEEGRITTARGDVRWVRTIGQAVRDAAGVIVGLQGAMQDVTGRKQLERQSLRSQRLESIGTLAGGIAHDLNNVLTPIAMGVGLLKSEEQDEGRLQLLDVIEASAARAAEMVRQVLSFARGVEGQRKVHAPAQLLSEAAALLSDTLPKQIRLEIDTPEDLWPVLAEQTQMQQVIVNLCVNARDAMPDGGTLTIRGRNVTITQASADDPALAPGRYVTISVQDTGEGIAPGVIDRIFDPFFTTKPTGLGTGLGLSTALGLVRGHGGRIDVRSVPGRGSCFEVLLPAADIEAGRRADQAGVPSTPVHGKGTVLVVDDESAVRGVSRHVLEGAGYAVIEAGSGEEAVTALSSRGEDVVAVLTDMMMPGMDGPALARHIRARWPDIPVVGMSGLGAAGRFSTETLGVRAFLPKPFTPDVLRSTLEAVLSGPA
jgi:two-component system cell cycle sensor histidine kinase/response regulator CckA